MTRKKEEDDPIRRALLQRSGSFRERARTEIAKRRAQEEKKTAKLVAAKDPG